MNEIWKSLEGIVECGDNYEVSNFGNVRNVKTGRILKPNKHPKGYMLVKLCKDGKEKMLLR